MSQTFETAPAHTVRPGTVVDEDGVIFSTVFRSCKSCGLILYRLSDLDETVIPFTDEYRYGSLYSVKVKGLKPGRFAYRYYRDDYSFEDPYARELITLSTKNGPLTACRLFPQNENALPAYGYNSVRPWADQVIYVMHVKGFTASRTSHVAHRGTFRGVTEKIDELKKIGVTAIELLPVYELRPASLGKISGAPNAEESEKTMAQDAAKYVTDDFGTPKPEAQKVNYWGFGEGCYFAPKHAYASSKSPQQEFASMVDMLHQNGIQVYLQLFFTDDVSNQTQLETARFYVTHYHVDGFHIKGADSALKTIASDPMLSNTAILYYGFPYEELQKEDSENPTVGKPSIAHLCEYTDSYMYLVRRFVKSDNNVAREFAKQFVTVPEVHGRVHFVTNYDTFTLRDLVSYNWKHNAPNGEEGRDGNDNNCSWNCGVEGKSQKKDVRTLRLRQMKNFIALNFLSQGTPVLTAGDEMCNSQDGNNNAYCQDNETGWVSWKETGESRNVNEFTKDMAAFRRDHAIFRRRNPFKFNDYKVTGYPDVSFHGKDAWKPDFSNYSHTFGVMYDEDYAEENPTHNLVYVAVNMHWHNQLLGVPTPPPGLKWYVTCDTFEENSFFEHPQLLPDQRHIFVKGRSVCILVTSPEPEKSQNATAIVAMTSYFHRYTGIQSRY